MYLHKIQYISIEGGVTCQQKTFFKKPFMFEQHFSYNDFIHCQLYINIYSTVSSIYINIYYFILPNKEEQQRMLVYFIFQSLDGILPFINIFTPNLVWIFL